MQSSTRFDREVVGWLRVLGLVIATALLITTSACGLGQKPLVLNVPTPDCGAPTLTIDATDFRIESITPKFAGAIDV
ncbi:MAG: hypothetical protein ACM3MF_02030, partial [Anaerolineae bacterium]